MQASTLGIRARHSIVSCQVIVPPPTLPPLAPLHLSKNAPTVLPPPSSSSAEAWRIALWSVNGESNKGCGVRDEKMGG